MSNIFPFVMLSVSLVVMCVLYGVELIRNYKYRSLIDKLVSHIKLANEIIKLSESIISDLEGDDKSE